MTTRSLFTSLCAASLLLVGGAMFCLVGCGGNDGPARYNVSGTVTYQGKALPAGRIYFTPDASQGNRGPQGFATIENGAYSTSDSGKGTVGGPHKVSIAGFDGVAVQEMDDMLEMGKPLFAPYETTVDLPKEASTNDFDVP